MNALPNLDTAQNLKLQSKNLIIVNYCPFAGGNFIINCLSLSKHALMRTAEFAPYLLDQPDDYETRIALALKSLPPKTEMHKWTLGYEYNDISMFGKSDWGMQPTDLESPKFLKDAILKNMDFFISSHGGGTERIKKILKFWPDAKLLHLINADNFWKIAYNLKRRLADEIYVSMKSLAGNLCQESYNAIAGPSWPSWDLFQRCNYNVEQVKNKIPLLPNIENEITEYYAWNQLSSTPTFSFDIDSNIFNKENFLSAMQRLYEELGYDDFNPELVGKYWQAYMSLHIDNEDKS